MAKRSAKRKLPRPAAELKRLASYYDTHDTSSDLRRAERVEPQAMITTSLRLPEDIVVALKSEARESSVRYTALLRRVLEDHVKHPRDDELEEIKARLSRIERRILRR